jgi:hypothetical protein
MMNLSNKAGMMNGDYIFIGSSTWTFGSDTYTPVWNQQEQEYLQGVMAVGLPITAASVAGLYARLAARTPLLYPPYLPDGPINTRSMMYDAVTAVGLVVKNLTNAGIPLTGPNLIKALQSPIVSTFLPVLRCVVNRFASDSR